MGESEIIELIRARDERGAEELLRHFGALLRYVIAPILPDERDREGREPAGVPPLRLGGGDPLQRHGERPALDHGLEPRRLGLPRGGHVRPGQL